MDWSQGVNAFACILKDTQNGKPSADNVGDEVAALYMPTEVRMVMTVVEAGSVYMSPSEMGGDTDTETGGETSDGEGGSESESDSGTTSDSGDPGDESSSGDSSSGDSSSEDSGDSGGSSEDEVGTSDGVGQQPEQSTGCGCSSTPAEPAPLGFAGLLLGGLALLRRRRGDAR